MSFKSGKEGQSEEEEDIAHVTKIDDLIWMSKSTALTQVHLFPFIFC